jgi:hypothetical protein
MAGRTNQQLYEDNQKKINRQDDILDEIIDTVQVSNNTAREINSTLKVQDKMLDKLGNKTDANTVHMKKTNSALDNILEKQSYCCLYIVIFCEVVALVLIFAYL